MYITFIYIRVDFCEMIYLLCLLPGCWFFNYQSNKLVLRRIIFQLNSKMKSFKLLLSYSFNYYQVYGNVHTMKLLDSSLWLYRCLIHQTIFIMPFIENKLLFLLKIVLKINYPLVLTTMFILTIRPNLSEVFKYGYLDRLIYFLNEDKILSQSQLSNGNFYPKIIHFINLGECPVYFVIWVKSWIALITKYSCLTLFICNNIFLTV